ncbi:MAG: GerMN domain-containing protein [Geobacter sp.]|nr:GerMN domain-containing protein [Geobacter sp.]
MSRHNRLRRRKSLLLAAFIFVALVFGALMVNRYMERRLISKAPVQPETGAPFVATLFFATPDGSGLKREARQIGICADPGECLPVLLEELANGPIGELAPTLPASAGVTLVKLEWDTAVLDLSPETVAALPAASSAEITAVYSIIDTLCFNFPQVKKVRFLVAGKEAQTLKGHLDLRGALEPDYTLVKE